MRLKGLGFWSIVLGLPTMFATGLIFGYYGAGIVPFGSWVVSAYVVAWKLYEYVYRTSLSIMDTDFIELRMMLVRRAKSVFLRVAVAVGIGLAAVALINSIYQHHITTKPYGDFVYYGAAILVYCFAYLVGFIRASRDLHEAVNLPHLGKR